MKIYAFFFTLVTLLVSVSANIYMHFPPGSINRNRERNNHTQNPNRMFDSQNSNNGGYQYCGSSTTLGETDGYEFYVGSEIPIQWTVQHSCGPNGNVECNVVLQFACEDTMPNIRDGWPTGPIEAFNDTSGETDYMRATFASKGQSPDGVNTIPIPEWPEAQNQFDSSILRNNVAEYTRWYNNLETVDEYIPVEFGSNEDCITHYRDRCLYREANQGLWRSDQLIGNNLQARRTRQNPDGNRHGCECPEERDYYPWSWQSSPWKDIAVFVDDLKKCDYYKRESQNVKSRWICLMSDIQRNSLPGRVIPVSQNACTAGQGSWVEIPSYGIAPPDCLLHENSRSNHLGNVGIDSNGMPVTQQYLWKIPEQLADQKCVIRIRYNISVSDFHGNQYTKSDPDFIDVSSNCPRTVRTAADTTAVNNQCKYTLTEDSVPLFNRPYVNFMEGYPEISMAYNTDQVGRVFQDRSHVLRFLPRPDSLRKAKIVNLNVRGNRGNIVQTYPQIEYDFVPSHVVAEEKDWFHFQFCGTDFTAERNANNGEGYRFSSRYNVLQIGSLRDNMPLHSSKVTMFKSESDMLKAAFGGITSFNNCGTYGGDDNNDNEAQDNYDNCGKMNSAPHRFNELIQLNLGTHYIMSSRNNNFSNRGQKGIITVKKVDNSLSPVLIGFITIGAVFIAGLVSLGGAFLYARANPDSKVASFIGVESRH